MLTEVRLIVKTTGERDLDQGSAAREHELRGEFHPPAHDVGMRRLSVSELESAGKMRLAQLDQCAQVGHQDRSTDMLFDITIHPLHLPAQQGRRWLLPCSARTAHVCLQERSGLLD